VGLLQKRILEKSSALINGEMDSWNQLAYEMNVKQLSLEQKIEHGGIALDTVFKVVEEMRKEFPSNVLLEVINLYKNLKRHTEKEKQIIIREHLKNCNLERFILENIEWFEKWLE